jgi:hypothetical protein
MGRGYGLMRVVAARPTTSSSMLGEPDLRGLRPIVRDLGIALS